MAFTVKNWQDEPNHTTPINAAALEDLEERVTDYADSVAGTQNLFVQETMPVSPPVGSLWIPLNPDGSAKPTDQWQVFTGP